MPTPPPMVMLAVASIPIGFAVAVWWMYRALHWQRIPAALALAAILAVTLAAPATPATAAGNGTTTATPTDTPTTTTTTTPTASANNTSIEELLEKDEWTRDDAQRAIEWIRSHDTSTLSQENRDQLHQRLLEYDARRGSGRQVPEDIYEAFTGTQTTTEPSDSTATPTPNTTENAENPPENPRDTEYVAGIDDSTRIVDWSYNNGRFEITLESDRPQLVNYIDGISKERGVTVVDRESSMIPEGTTTLTIPATEYRGLSQATVCTQVACARVSTGGDALTALELVRKYTAWFGGFAISFALTIAAGWYRKRKEAEKPREATRW